MTLIIIIIIIIIIILKSRRTETAREKNARPSKNERQRVRKTKCSIENNVPVSSRKNTLES